MQILLSLPPALAELFSRLEGKPAPKWFAASDPPGGYLGSGGGTTQLLVEAWKETGGRAGFREWLATDRKLIIHAGGQSRRLPAYAATSKILLPIPVFRWAKGQRLDQTLLDLQLPLYEHILEHAPPATRVMVTCGDVLLRSRGPLPPLPDVDVLSFGLWMDPETATRHGVFFLARSEQERLKFFRQKPSVDEIRTLAAEHLFLIDTGIWLLSERAVRVLMGRSQWVWQPERFAGDAAGKYELFAEFGLSLGSHATVPDAEIGGLTAAVLPLPRGEFYHFGATSDLVNSCLHLQNLVLDQREVGAVAIKPHPAMFVQNARRDVALEPENHTLWIENAVVPASWRLACRHVITGVPDNDWKLKLPPGLCLDVVPVGDARYCVRVYGIADVFRGAIGDADTRWCGKPARDWFESQVDFEKTLRELFGGGDLDIQDAPLFPVLEAEELDGRFVQWLVDGSVDASASVEREQTLIPTLPETEREGGSHAAAISHEERERIRAAYWQRWLQGPRLSASQLAEQANLDRIYAQRRALQSESLLALAKNASRSVFYNLDLAHTAEAFAASGHPLPADEAASVPLMRRVHQRMFLAVVRRQRGDARWTDDEHAAFRLLREAMIASTGETKVQPQQKILDDQIIWGRSPVRLDLAGGWTDTPPHCLIHGGKVVNVAVNLNGQPPVQAFVRLARSPHVVLRSIDLGVEERITAYDDLRRYAEVGSGFSIAKAALALAGFLPEFCGQPAFASLESQLRAFGGGIEISLLAAVPKGSGLGTSSILAATLLGTLGELCGLNWDRAEICRRTLTLEQMLTTGGGWQDQIGGAVRGLKLTETQPGLNQDLVVRWLPAHLFEDAATKSCLLLYYTGITRVAKNILAEIVRGMFLNSSQHLATLEQLGQHALATYEVLLRGDWRGLCECIARSWQLNQKLDPGTNPAEVQTILDRVQDYLAGQKLLGAGGGGYMLMLAKDPEAAVRIRGALESSPPNAKARFVEFDVSSTGLEITRS